MAQPRQQYGEPDAYGERHPILGNNSAFGLEYASVVRLPRPGWQYIVAPEDEDGRPILDKGVRDIWRDPAEADKVRDNLRESMPGYDWHTWSREITEWEIDE